MDTKATEVLLGGATRGGKTFFIKWSYIWWCSQIPGLQTDIFRLNYDDVIGNFMAGTDGFRVLLAPWLNDGLVTITESQVKFWNGSLISLEHCSSDDVLAKHQGRPKHLRTFDEATQIKEERIKWLRSWVSMDLPFKTSMPEQYRDVFPRIYYTANPIGESFGYFRREFVKARSAMAIEQVGAFKRQYIPARVSDNPSEDEATVIARVGEIGDAAIADALINGNWDAPVGDFYPEWYEPIHVVPDITPPLHWFRFGGYDWGQAEPFCFHFVAVSDGEPFTDNQGRKHWFPRGCYVVYKEYYGCDEQKPQNGLGLRNEDVREKLIALCEPEERWITWLTDKLPFQDRGGESIAEIFWNKGKGIKMIEADTSRIQGWSKLRDRLIGFKIDDQQVPMIVWCESCKAARDYIPMLQRHKSEGKRQDAQDHGEATHVCDTDRYIAMAYSRIKDLAEPDDVAKKSYVDSVNKMVSIASQVMTFDQVTKKIQRNKARERSNGW